MDKMQFDKDAYIDLLRKLIGEVRNLQNNPPQNVPQEDLASDHVLRVLEPYSKEKGGPLLVKRETFVAGRGNVLLEYRSANEDAPYVSFVGSHLDVVPANPDEWDFNPYELTVDGDVLRGRGVTDCLGHVAMITEVFKQLAINKPALKVHVAAVFIANEENSTALGVGVDELAARGMMEKLKSGPVYWVDSADKQPCLGTAGMVAWQLKATGKLFHSGLPHQAINPMEMAMEAVANMQSRFYKDFPPHEKEKAYGFVTCSSMKPTQWSYPGGGINQIPAECTICGDMRLTPFYSADDAIAKVKSYVDDINRDIEALPSRGPVSKYNLPDQGLRGKLELEIMGAPCSGIACSIDSVGNKLICEATQEVLGECKPYSLTGSLPLVKELQDQGFDLQIVGFGLMKTYHAKNEFGLLSDFESGFKILSRIIAKCSDRQ